jgi:hypothetical protein
MLINTILGLIIVLLIILILKLNTEPFNGRVFGISPTPPHCHPATNCYQGQPSRIAMYENMCEPKNIDASGYRLPIGQGLLRAPRQPRDNCMRGFDIKK